jgi:hypothetical protein
MASLRKKNGSKSPLSRMKTIRLALYWNKRRLERIYVEQLVNSKKLGALIFHFFPDTSEEGLRGLWKVLTFGDDVEGFSFFPFLRFPESQQIYLKLAQFEHRLKHN